MTKSALNQKIDLLEKALLRERSAKAEAERQLEIYSRETYHSQETLVGALKNSDFDRNQLEFLAFLTERICIESDPVSLRKSFASLLSELISFTWVATVVSDNGELVFDESFFKLKGDLWAALDSNKQAIALAKSINSLNEDIWHSFSAKDAESLENIELKDQQRLLIYKYSIGDIAGAIILLSVNRLVVNQLNTLNAATKQFTSALARLYIEQTQRDSKWTLDNVYKQLEHTQNILNQNERLISLGQMAAGIAHEINNPLAYVSSNIEICNETLRDFLVDNQGESCVEDVLEMLALCSKGIEKIGEIVRSMMTLARQGQEDFDFVNLVTLIQDALRVVSSRTKHGYEIIFNYPQSLPLMRGNPGELEQVFINLIVNALDAMPDGGTLTISIKLTNEYLVVELSDTGIGMSEEVLSSIFNPFFTTKKVSKGTGLGLSISYAILEKHGVDIEVSSKVGQGTNFILRFKL